MRTKPHARASLTRVVACALLQAMVPWTADLGAVSHVDSKPPAVWKAGSHTLLWKVEGAQPGKRVVCMARLSLASPDEDRAVQMQAVPVQARLTGSGCGLCGQTIACRVAAPRKAAGGGAGAGAGAGAEAGGLEVAIQSKYTIRVLLTS